MDFVILVILLAIIDRIKEYTIFGRWFQNSRMAKIKNKALREWLESDASNKWKPWGKWTFPFMYDLYHHLKGWIVLVLSSWHVYHTDCWVWLIIDPLVWWGAQVLLEGDDTKHSS